MQTQTNAANLPLPQRMDVLRKLTESAGWGELMPGTIVPEGTALIPYGEQRLRALKQKVDSLPPAAEALSSAATSYAALSPVDVLDSVSRLRMDAATGKLFRALPPGSKGRVLGLGESAALRLPADSVVGPKVGYSHTGLAQLIGMTGDALGIPRNFTAALEYLSPAARAAAANDVFTRAEERKVHLPKRVFRTILNRNGERYLRAVTSEVHVGAAADTAKLCAAIRAALQRMGLDAKARVLITHDRTDVELFFPLYNREIRVGDVALGRARVVISETKDRAATVEEGLLRVLCLNFTTAWFGSGQEFSRRHVGNGVNFLRLLAERLVTGLDRLAPFVQAFGDSYSNAFPANLPTRAEVLARAAKVFRGELPAATWDAANTLWDADGLRSAGDTLAGLVNAMTRASQAMALDDADAVEAAAGRLTVEGWAALA